MRTLLHPMYCGSRKSGLLVRTALLAALAFGAALGISGTRAAGKLDAPLVVTQIPRQAARPLGERKPDGLARGDWFEGARLVLVSPEGQARVLARDFHAACDPNVSFDGKRILFAGRKEAASRWRVWEIGIDGEGLRPITSENMEARAPIHATTLFTLDSPEPWVTTVFVGRDQSLSEVGRASASSLYNIKLDGTELRRLTFNPNNNVDPFQTIDGRLIYAAERYPSEPGTKAGRMSLYAIHVEGADMELYGGEMGQRVQQMPCVTAGGLVVFVEMDQPSWDGAGQLACLEERRPHVTYKRLTQDPAFAYLYPSPWRENRVLVSRRATEGSAAWGVYCFDASRGECEPVFESPEVHAVQAVVVQPRSQPDGHSTVVDPKHDYGTLYGLNCYTTDKMREGHLKPGEIKRVRFLEGVVQQESKSPGQVPGLGPSVPRRLIGEAPVEADGSFNVELPADRPILLQTLDERGLALGNCGWIWVKPKENRGCIGCHEDPELIPENEYVLALRRPPNRLLLPPAQRRSVGFREEVVPILRKHCAAADCHGGNKTPLALPLAGNRPADQDCRAAYAALLAPGGGNPADPLPQRGRYIDAGRARTSWLVWQLAGTNTSRPWDRDNTASGRKVAAMPPAGQGTPLSQEEFLTIGQWIDSGAPEQAVKPTAEEIKSEAKTPQKP